MQNTEFEFRQWTDLRVQELAFDPPGVQGSGRQLKSRGRVWWGSDPGGQETGGGVAAEENV
jgi:hypothetical protein